MTRESHDALIARLAGGLEAGEEPRSRRTLAWFWFCAPPLAMLAAFVVLRLRPELLEGRAPLAWCVAALGLASASGGALAWAWLSALPARRAPAWLAALCGLGLLAVIAGLGLNAEAELANSGAAVGLAPWGARCAGIELLLAILPAIFFFVVFRRLAPTRPALTGALGLAAIGGLTALVLSMHCLSDHPVHVLVWHLVPALLMTVAGAVAGRRFLRW